MGRWNKGFTFAEVILASIMISMILGVLAIVFQTVAASWSAQGARIGLGARVSKAAEEMATDLRKARAIGAVNNDEIRFTIDGATYYIYYLYNAANTYPPAFNKPSYQLRRAALTGGMSGTFTYGSGDLIARDILPPPASDLSYAGALVTIDLSAQCGNGAAHVATKAKTRNAP